jgi:O-antigen/teichoic acid export membrane protein
MKLENNLTRNKTRLLAINISTNLMSRMVVMVVGMIALPYKLNYFGDVDYGLFLLASSLATYLQRMDFGIGVTLIKYTSELVVNDQYQDMSKLYSFGLLFNSAIGAIAASIIVLAGYFSKSLFSVGADEYSTFWLLSLIIAAQLFANRILSIPRSLLLGGQRHFFVNFVNSLQNIINLGLLFWAIWSKWSIVAYVLATSSGFILLSLPMIIYTRIIYPEVKITRFQWRGIKNYMTFSWHMIKSQLASIMMFESNKIILGIFAPAIAVTRYHIGERLHGLVRPMLNAFVGAFMPLMSEKVAAKDKGYLDKAIYEGSRIVSLIWYPFIIILILNSRNILRLWIGEKYEFLWLFASLFLTPYLFSLPLAVLSNVLIGTGNIDKYMNLKLLAGFVNIGITCALTGFYGIWGALVGMLAQSVLFLPFYYKIYLKSLGIDGGKFFKKVIIPASISAIVTMAFGLSIKELLMPQNLLELVGLLGLSLLMSYIFTLLLNRDDIRLVMRAVGVA